MKLRDINWIILRVPLLVLCIASAAGAAYVYYTNQALQRAIKQFNSQQYALDNANQRYAKADEEKKIILRYLGDYQNLQQQGFIGTEQRINWIDALREVNQQLRLFGVEYQISQQVAVPFILDTGNFQLQQSRMKLKFRILHEEDLTRFFDKLAAQQTGLFLLEKCDLQRTGAAAFSVRFEPKLLAECELAWVTLSERTAGGK